jgi:hypothetical protein
MEPNEKFELMQKLLREIDAIRITDTPINEMAFVYTTGYQSAIDDVMNILRKEL